MARTTATNFSGGLQFPYATAATDVFHKEDIQVLAQAVDQHDHTAGKGHLVNTTPANGSITNAMLGSDTARANLLTNGSFRTWQRGNGAFTASGAFSADRWMLLLGAGCSLSVSRVQGSGPAPDPQAVTLNGAHTYSSGETSVAQTIKMADCDVRGQVVSCALWVRSSVSASNGLHIYTDGTAGPNTYVPYSTAGSWQRLVATITVPADATFVYVGYYASVSCSFYITDATLVVNSQPADYAPTHPADDLARCLRYYARMDNTNKLYHTPALCTATTTASGPASWPVQMAVTPTVTFNNVPGMQVVASGGNGLALTALTTTGQSVNGCLLQATVGSGLVTGNATYFTWGASAAIVAEANP